MVFKSITPLGHDYECGFPSGHSTFFMYIISFIFEEFILKRKLFINQSNLSILINSKDYLPIDHDFEE